MWLTDPIRDKDGTLSISRAIKYTAWIGFVYSGYKLAQGDPLTAVLTFGAFALGQAPISALAARINPEK